MKDAVMGFLYSHARQEQRVVNGVGSFWLVWDTCPLCDAGLAAAKIDEAEWQIVGDSNPPERVEESPQDTDV